LREALAGTDHDFLLRDGKRAGATRSASGRKQKKSFFRLPRLPSRPRTGTLILLGLAAITIVGIPLNALFLQDGRHPAPLFGAPAPPPAPPAEHVPLPPPRPIAPQALAKAPIKADAVKADEAPPEAVARPVEKTRDPIGLLLAGTAPKSEEADKKVLFAQHALVKLGYVLRADGRFGGTTRQALEKFERDSGLPVKGELTPKILRQLSARSGVPLEH
jgi:peptidoglycan hydrolase-like protein with peptidoglycan-binding domain